MTQAWRRREFGGGGRGWFGFLEHRDKFNAKFSGAMFVPGRALTERNARARPEAAELE